MIDTFVDKLHVIFASEPNKRISEICKKLPELLEGRDNVTLCEQDIETEMGICKKCSIEYCGDEKACFCVGFLIDDKGNLQIKASDVVYL